MVFSIIYFPVTIIIKKKQNHFNLRRYFVQTIFMYYVIVVISITFSPIPMTTRWSASIQGFSELNQRDNFIPFYSIFDILFHSVDSEVILKQIGGNILLFVPFGFSLPIVSSKYCKPMNMFIASILFSSCIEFGQALIGFIIGITYRSTDIDDVFLNVIRGMLGLSLIKLVLHIFTIGEPNISERNT